MSTPLMLNRYRIVVALDQSEYGEIVLEHALDQAARHEAPDLHVITVVAHGSDVELEKHRVAALVRETLETFRAGTDWRARVHLAIGSAPEEIATLASDIRADLVVVGRFGTHGRRSVADRVLELAPCPTLVVGLTDRPVEAHEPCPLCAALREDTDGEQWFCKAHAAPERLRLTMLLPTDGPLSHGGLLW